jgi:ribose 1,5-bisphosphokinase
VSEAPTISADRPVGIGPGRLVLVVIACAGDRNVVFPRRVVTREASQAEDNEQLSPEAFRQAVARGEFTMHWEAHGHRYGLSRAIEDDVCEGRTVVVNVSRTVVDALRRAYADVVVVAVTAPPEALAERLASRARGSDGRIEQRLGRAVDEAAVQPDVTILNVGNAEVHAERLVRIIKGA